MDPLMPYCHEIMADGIMNKALNPSSIRAAARAVRAKLGIQDQPAPDFRDVLEKLSQVFPKTQVKVVSAANAPALAWTDSKTLYVQKSVVEGLTKGDVRARYIIAHEIGHLVLKHQAPKYRAVNDATRLHRDWKMQELEAALFADAFLMPASLVKQFQTADGISATFQISHSTASNRIAELVSGHELPLAPATRARTDLVNELIDLGYSEGEISELVVPKRTLARRRADRELLTVEETDKALRLGRIARQAARVFGDPTKAHRWLRKPKHALNGESPVAFLASEEGARKVEDMLHRIDHGIFA
ncbi:MAG: DUF2384 domain-containing protein [Deltaproteobacteria bacterium]|nr:DUF2384 domain-containing protein [Deltaproteobacteria bacterium]